MMVWLGKHFESHQIDGNAQVSEWIGLAISAIVIFCTEESCRVLHGIKRALENLKTLSFPGWGHQNGMNFTQMKQTRLGFTTNVKM